MNAGLRAEPLRRAERDQAAPKAQLAFLTDRVLLAEGKPQEFGTQATGRKGQWIPCSLRDPGRVDQRRAAMSLGPLARTAGMRSGSVRRPYGICTG